MGTLLLSRTIPQVRGMKNSPGEREAYQESQGGNLKQEAKLGLGAGAGHVGEDSLFLHDNLEHICAGK